MGLYRRGKTYWITFSCDGRQHQRSTGTAERKLAEKIFSKVQTQIVEGKWFEFDKGRQYGYEEMMDKYLKEHSKPNKALGSYQNDLNYRRHLDTVFSDLTLDKITPRLINEFKSKRISEGASNSTLAKELICLGHALNFACKEWEWITVNPMNNVKKPRINNRRDRWLSHEDESALLQKAYDWFKPIVIFAIHTGMRQGEIIRLKWNDVDLFRRTLVIHKSKNNEKRTIPINQRVLELLIARSKVQAIHGHVFCDMEGGILTKRKVQRSMTTAMTHAGIKNFHFHDLRHTFATRLAQAGIDIYSISKLLGHRDIRMTQRYAHHSPESLRQGVDVLCKPVISETKNQPAITIL